MKKILILLFVLAGIAGKAQYIKMTAYGYDEKRHKADSVQHIPVLPDTASLYTTDTSAQIRIFNNAIYWHYGYWRPFGSGGSGAVYVDSIYKRADSFFYTKNNNEFFIGIDSVGEGFDSSILRGVYMDTAFKINDSTTRYCKGTTCWDISLHFNGGTSGAITQVIAQNGLSSVDDSTVELGSSTSTGAPLLHDTYIEGANFSLTHNNLNLYSINGDSLLVGINTTNPRATQEINGNIYVADSLLTNGNLNHDRISQYYGLITSHDTTSGKFPTGFYAETKTAGTTHFKGGNSAITGAIANVKLNANINTIRATGIVGRAWATGTDSVTQMIGILGGIASGNDVADGTTLSANNVIAVAASTFQDQGTIIADSFAYFKTMDHYTVNGVPNWTEDIQNKYGLFLHDYTTGGHTNWGIYQQGSTKKNLYQAVSNYFPNISNGIVGDSILVIDGGELKKILASTSGTIIDTIFSFTTDSIVISKKLRIPLTDTIHAKKGCGNIIYDTILEHFYGDVCINGVHSSWGCFDCVSGTGTVTSVATNNGSGITGGTITTTGTLAIDTTVISTKANVTSVVATKFNTSDTNQLGRNYIDVFLVGGQSNASGGSQVSLFTVPTGKVLQFYNETFTDANDPVGNALNGSAWPAFGVNWWTISGHKLCFVPSAQPSSSQASAAAVGFGNWDTTGVLFDSSVARLNRAVSRLQALGYTPIIRGILWSQGETDASKINSSTITQATYLAALRKMIGRYRTNFRNIPFYIFRTGKDTTSSVSDVGFAAVRSAQQTVANQDSLTAIVMWDAVDFPTRGWMNDNLHWNRAANAYAGRVGAENILASTGMKWQSHNDTGSTNNNYLFYMGGKVGFKTFNPAFNIDVTGTGRFTDTLRDDIILSLSDSSYDVPNTAWIKRQSFATGTPSTPGGNTWDVQVNNAGTFYGSDSLTWNPVNRHMVITNSKLNGTGDSAQNALMLTNTAVATNTAGQQSLFSPMLAFKTAAYASGGTPGSRDMYWGIRNAATTGSGITSHLEFANVQGVNGNPNPAPTAWTVRAFLDESGNATFGGTVNSNSGGTGTMNANSFLGAGITLLSTNNAATDVRMGARNNLTVFGTTFNTGIATGATASSSSGSPVDQGATFFTYRPSPLTNSIASGIGSVSNSAGGTTVTGSSTKFLDFFKKGDSIRIINGGTAETQVITAIASNTSLTTATFTNVHTGATSYQATTGALGVTATGAGLVGVGLIPNPNTTGGLLTIAAGTANYAPIQATAGPDLTTGVDGALNWTGTDWHTWDGTTLYTVDKSLTGSATLDFASTGAGAVADLTITVTGAASGDVVSLGVPAGSVTATATFTAWVSSANTVTVRFSPKATEDPASGTFKVRVIQ